MKRAYQDKILSNFEAIEKRTSILKDIAEGKRQQDQREAVKLIREIDHLVESTRSIVSLVPTN